MEITAHELRPVEITRMKTAVERLPWTVVDRPNATVNRCASKFSARYGQRKRPRDALLLVDPSTSLQLSDPRDQDEVEDDRRHIGHKHLRFKSKRPRLARSLQVIHSETSTSKNDQALCAPEISWFPVSFIDEGRDVTSRIALDYFPDLLSELNFLIE